MHAFSEGDKLLFKGGEADDRTIWRFGCFNQEDDTDLECGLVSSSLFFSQSNPVGLIPAPLLFQCFQINGEVAIPGIVLRREVFDPVVDTVRSLFSLAACKSSCQCLVFPCFQVLELIDTQIKRNVGPVDALLLVGGFSASEYLMRRVEERFGRVVRVIARPGDCDVATVQGAARYGLTKKVLVSSVVCPKAYVVRSSFFLRPARAREAC